MKVFGVDFSGSVKAGNLIWISTGVYEKGGLNIYDCCRARDLPGGEIFAKPALRLPAGRN